MKALCPVQQLSMLVKLVSLPSSSSFLCFWSELEKKENKLRKDERSLGETCDKHNDKYDCKYHCTVRPGTHCITEQLNKMNAIFMQYLYVLSK